LPIAPKELAQVPPDFLNLSQFGPNNQWTNCKRGSFNSIYDMNSGCADTSLATIIAHWYTYSSSVRSAWKDLLSRNPTPDNNSNYCKKPTVGFSDFPNPYNVLMLLNGFTDKSGNRRVVNLDNGAWDIGALNALLKELNLQISWDGSLTVQDIKGLLDTGYSVSVFCDYYRYQFRSCCIKGGPAGEKCACAYNCDHWMTPYKVDDSGNIYFKDPAGNLSNQAISSLEFNNMGCGTGARCNSQDKKSFLIIPITWP